MLIPQFAPPITAPDALATRVAQDGYAVTDASWARACANATVDQLSRLARDWEDMPVDPYLRDGGNYRRRRHASLIIERNQYEVAPARAHFQSPEYNALHGGMMRWFTPMHDSVLHSPLWRALVCGAAAVCSAVDGAGRWHVEAHQFRIDTSEGIGRPTPEGAHRDGVDFVALFLVTRHDIRGGETRVFEAAGPRGLRFTLTEPWSLLLLDDRRVIHETTPIQPLTLGAHGHRDTLVLTFRRAGFQEPTPE